MAGSRVLYLIMILVGPDIAPKIDIAEIIKAAAGSTLGITALVLLILAFLSFYFFKEAPLKMRLYVLIMVFTASIGLFGVTVYHEMRVEKTKAENDAAAKRAQDTEKAAAQKAHEDGEARPSISTGNITTNGSKSPVMIGNNNPYSPDTSKKPKKKEDR